MSPATGVAVKVAVAAGTGGAVGFSWGKLAGAALGVVSLILVAIAPDVFKTLRHSRRQRKHKATHGDRSEYVESLEAEVSALREGRKRRDDDLASQDAEIQRLRHDLHEERHRVSRRDLAILQANQRLQEFGTEKIEVARDE